VHEPFNLETFQVPLREWVEQEQTQMEIKRRFVSAGAGAAASAGSLKLVRLACALDPHAHNAWERAAG
jgi:hypothetical protein